VKLAVASPAAALFVSVRALAYTQYTVAVPKSAESERPQCRVSTGSPPAAAIGVSRTSHSGWKPLVGVSPSKLTPPPSTRLRAIWK
jgi:hypothetical protein